MAAGRRSYWIFGWCTMLSYLAARNVLKYLLRFKPEKRMDANKLVRCSALAKYTEKAQGQLAKPNPTQ